MKTADDIRSLMPVEADQTLIDSISDFIERAAIYGKRSITYRISKNDLKKSQIDRRLEKLGFNIRVTEWRTTDYQDIFISW